MASEKSVVLQALSSKPAVLADQATDLTRLRESVADAAGVSAGLWLSYLFVLVYLLIAVGGVTHRNLFFEDPVRLPFLNVDLPLVGFFVLGPALFLIVHAYVLLHFSLLADKVGNFQSELHATISDDTTSARLRQLLPSNIFVQVLAGPREVRGSNIGKMLRLVALISLVVGPLMLLVFFQFQFLPYHPSWTISLWLRSAVVLDLILLWTLWPSVSHGKVPWSAWRYARRAIVVPAALGRFSSAIFSFTARNNRRWFAWRVFWRVLPRATVVAAAALSLIPVLLVFMISTFPGEWLYEQRNALPLIRNLHQLLFAGTPNEVTGRPSSWFSNRLVLTDQSFVDPEKFDKVDVSHSFRGRDLSYAVLSRADLRKADFTGATLTNAALSSAHLQNARFGCARTGNDRQETGCAVLRGADLKLAQLQGADLTRVQLQKAHLEGAQIQGAVLKFARLEGALLQSAQLQDLDLGEANLQDAMLTEAQLQRARLGGATLKSSNLVRAILQGADAGGVQLQGAVSVQTQFQGANLGGARLQGADLTNSNLEGTDLTLAELEGVNLLQASSERSQS